MVLGCILGMAPLLWLDVSKVQAQKRQAHLDALFRDVVTEAGSLVGAQHTALYVRVVDVTEKDADPHGEFLYHTEEQRWRPLGRGLVSRAALTQEAWNIRSVQDEPDCTPEEAEAPWENMLCVPIMDSAGNSIAVLQASRSGEPFGEQHLQILKALASHISVALLRLYGDGEEERLRDTIQLLRKYGLSGLQEGEEDRNSGTTWKPLFPEDDDDDDVDTRRE